MELDIKWIGSPNFRAQNGVEKKFIVLHWMVGNLSGTDRVFQNASRRVATNYGIEENKIHQYVKDKDYAFGSGTTYANKHGISIEHEGGQLLKDGTRKKPTKGTLETSAKLCAKIARDHNLGELKLMVNVFPHKHFVATQCPGSLDMEYIVNRANQINAELAKPSKPVEKPVVVEPAKPAAKPTQKPSKPADKPVSKPKTYTVKAGDNLTKIARTHNTTIAVLKKLNNIKNANLIRVGQVIKLP